jgi:TctA family transporter
MKSIKRVFLALIVGAFLFLGVFYIYPYGAGVALLFIMTFFAISCSYIALNKNRSKIFWFIVGLFTGILGLAMALNLKEAELNEL